MTVGRLGSIGGGKRRARGKMIGASHHTKVWATKEMYEDEVNWQHGARKT